MIKIITIRKLREEHANNILNQSKKDTSTLFGFDTRKLVMGGTLQFYTFEYKDGEGMCSVSIECTGTEFCSVGQGG